MTHRDAPPLIGRSDESQYAGGPYNVNRGDFHAEDSRECLSRIARPSLDFRRDRDGARDPSGQHER